MRFLNPVLVLSLMSALIGTRSAIKIVERDTYAKRNTQTPRPTPKN